VRRVKSEDLKVGQIVRVLNGDRIPADMVILHSDAPQGEVFIKTDQLDGETDWKLRKAVKLTQAQLNTSEEILSTMTNDYFCKIE
jgi:phospholipid-translocating ATPase